MARFLVACTPLQGHVTPLLAISRELVDRGHEVTVCTGKRFTKAVTAIGARPVPLPAPADYDDRRLEELFGGQRPRGRIARANADIVRLLADPLDAQRRAVDELVDVRSPAAVVIDTSFLGGLAWRAGAGPPRPPLAVANVTYLTIRGRGVPPAGPGFAPAPGLRGRVRDVLLRVLTDRVLVRRGLGELDRAVCRSIGRSLPGLLFDGPASADLLLMLTTPSMEYGRRSLPACVRYVGPVAAPCERFTPPPWWGELREGRPVVVVTQGTMDTADLGALIAPTLTALADEDVLVVATTGGRPVSAVPGPVPPNARIASYLPFGHLLPLADVMVTNGGYGGVQQSLAAGVPLLVAGRGEDKPEIAARVAWTGAGLRLAGRRPRPVALRRAVRRLLQDPSFGACARNLQAEMRGHDGARSAADELEALAGS